MCFSVEYAVELSSAQIRKVDYVSDHVLMRLVLFLKYEIPVTSKDFIRVKHTIATYILEVLNRSSQEGGVAVTDIGRNWMG